MKFFLLQAIALLFTATLSAKTVYVDNIKGNDANPGSKEQPVATIQKGLSLLKTSDRHR